MKKQILGLALTAGLATGALAQGSINVDASLSNFGGAGGITTQGTGAASTSLDPNSSLWYTGNISLQIYAATSATAAQLTAINSYLNQTGGASKALSLLISDGFVEAETTTPTSGTVGAVTSTIADGAFNNSTSTIGLAGVATGGSGYLALVATITSGAYAGYEGVIAFANGFGGNPSTVPAGTPTTLTGWNALNENLVLSAATPEPTTMALAGIGIASLAFLRRKK